jgi:hypothetical protein
LPARKGDGVTAQTASRISTLGGPLSAALRRMSARERWLVGLLGLVMVTAAAVTAAQWSGDQREREVLALAELQARRQAAARATAGGPGPGVRAQLAAADAWSLHAPDIWIARVRVEEHLAAAAQAAGVQNAQVEVFAGREADAQPVVRAEVSGPYQRPQLVGLLQRVYAGPSAVVVERIQVKAVEDPSFKLSLLYPVAADAAEPPP